MAKKVVLAGACRTAIGKMGGALSNTPAADLGAIVIKEALNRAGVKPEMVDEVKMGCVIQAAQGQNVARQASIKAGLPIEVPAITINVVCGSGLKCVNDAATMIMAGEADIVVAGGMENMSMAPYAMTKARFGYRMNNATIIDTMVNDALTDAFNHYHMMITAENVCDKYGITREELDEFSANSQQKCEAAIAAGKFDDEIVPVPVKVKKEMVDFVKDEGPRPGTTAESLSKLRCCSGKEGGLVTAGNASGINDGAAAIVVMSEEKAKELGVTPMATWVAGALGGVEPEIMGVGPVASTKKVLAKTGLSIDDFDLIEANEAFAAQSIAVARDLKFDMSKVNVNGGAIALGHPVGASGCRILVTLLHEMQKRGSNRGLATLCIGGGMGCSSIVEKYKFFCQIRYIEGVRCIPLKCEYIYYLGGTKMKVGVIGAGTMGQGIAKAFAQVDGYEVALCDIKQEWAEGGKDKIAKGYARLVAKEKMTQEKVDGILAKITPGLKEDLCKDCDLIVEAAFEDMNVKKTTFAELDKIAKPECIFASNTSSLSITEIGNGLTRPMIGMHFFNPADRMKLVEVIAGVNTPAETVEAIKKIAVEIGKTPVQVNEAAGFVVNRILIPMINEAAFIKMEGVSDIAGIDAAMKLGANHPMGPLELGDFIGLDICLAIMDVLYNETGDSKYRACPLIRKMVRGGNLGAKSGKGFYIYNADRTKTPVDAQ